MFSIAKRRAINLKYYMADDSPSPKYSKRSFLKMAGSLTGAASALPASVKTGGVFALFQTLFRAPNAEAQTWQKLQVGPPKLKVRTPQRNKKQNRNVIACGGGHYALVLRADGAIFTTGWNYFGGLGDNTTVEKKTLVSAIGISSAVTIGGGYLFSLALRADGAVFACGTNRYTASSAIILLSTKALLFQH